MSECTATQTHVSGDGACVMVTVSSVTLLTGHPICPFNFTASLATNQTNQLNNNQQEKSNYCPACQSVLKSSSQLRPAASGNVCCQAGVVSQARATQAARKKNRSTSAAPVAEATGAIPAAEATGELEAPRKLDGGVAQTSDA
jgi:hypothetical protein